MIQNIYSLPDLIDLALTVPEVGAINFNILHTVLHAIVKELKIEDVRPWCQIDNALVSKTTATKAKLKEAARRRSTLEEFRTRPTPATASLTKEDAQKEEQTQRPVETEASPEPVEEQVDQPTTEVKGPVESESEFQPERQEKTEPPSAAQVDADEGKGAAAPEVAPKIRSPEGSEEAVPVEAVPKKGQRAGDAWRFTNLDMRVKAAEEGLHRLSNIVDIIADKLRKAEMRKQGGPSSAELEALDDRITELEDTMRRFAADHDLLMELQKSLNDILAEFEAIKALAAQLKQMQIDISMKADKEETWAALAEKADLELVHTKVDQTEFETAIEELGEAIGLLGLKFTRKNDEWEERAAEIWRAIDSKMSRDIFDAAMAKVQSRLTALMYGLRKLKKVVEDLLYPESSGVTRCILCRRPACIFGLECLSAAASPKRSLSDRSSDGEGDESKRMQKILNDVVIKRQKLDDPPYCESRDTIISIPYTSSSYRSSAKEKEIFEPIDMKLAPAQTEKKFPKKTSQVPKLPEIKDAEATTRPRSRSYVGKPKAKDHAQKASLIFTNKLLVEMDRHQESRQPEKYRYTVVLESEPAKKDTRPLSSKSSKGSVDILPEPPENIETFAPIRVMPDTLRRGVLKSSRAKKEGTPNLTLSPIIFDTDLNRSLPDVQGTKEQTKE